MKYVVIIFIVVVSSETIIECDSTHKGNILIIEAHYLTYFNFFLLLCFIMEGVLSELPMHEVTFIRRITAYSDAGLVAQMR